MNDKLMALYTELTTRLHTMANSRDEHGQGTLEYVGIAIVAAILVGAVVTALGDGSTIGQAIRDQIDDIISQG